MAKEFAAQGATVFLSGRRLAEISQVAAKICQDGGVAYAAEVDALDEQAVQAYLDGVAKEAGSIDILLNVMGPQAKDYGEGTSTLELPLEQFLVPLSTMLPSQFITARAAARHMVRQQEGVILFVTCIASGESSSLCLPNPLLSCSSLTGPYRLKRFHGLSPHSKPVLSQRQEDDRREAGSDESVATAFRMPGNGRDPVSEKREDVPLAHRWKLRLPRLFFTEHLSFCSLSGLGLNGAVLAAPLHHLSSVPLCVWSWIHWVCQRRYCLTGAIPS
jgi:short subunit dehydrogenase